MVPVFDFCFGVMLGINVLPVTLHQRIVVALAKLLEQTGYGCPGFYSLLYPVQEICYLSAFHHTSGPGSAVVLAPIADNLQSVGQIKTFIDIAIRSWKVHYLLLDFAVYRIFAFLVH